ncbi:MAG: MmgE/PrpD family protein, partial [Geminicoccaceae bacterium]
VRVILRDGSIREAHQPYLRGGVREPLGRAEITAKFRANAAHGGWRQNEAARLEAWSGRLFELFDLRVLASFRGG